MFTADGQKLDEKQVDVPQMGCPVIRISDWLRSLGVEKNAFGSLMWDLRTPDSVQRRIGSEGEPFLLWDRSYIGYIGPDNQTSFVHGIDKANLVMENDKIRSWPMRAKDSFVTVPEIPLLLSETKFTDVIVQNRGNAARWIQLSARDIGGRNQMWSAKVSPRGVHRFRLEAD
jgi:hypothetical protein